MRKTSKGTRYSTYLARVAEFYQKKEVKTYTNLILSVFAISFFAFLAIKPTMVTIASLVKEIRDEKEVAQKLENKLKNLAQAQREYSALKPKLHLIEASLPQTPQVSLFLGQVEVLAQKSGLKLSGVQTRDVTLKGKKITFEKKRKGQEKSPYPSFIINFSLSGDYPAIENFLRSISNLRRMVDIKSFSIKRTQKSSTDLLDLIAELEVFYFKKEN
jgi:Tfp pilus assembly protein PilO